ncbi:unnamed protein product [Nesidiocoris tenuis]|uniref:Uncharacterized protein n=1 Tax=Nesidiocoris tenuis TaxID=355587 RepID=A0A6H5H273_9HEMI|nr:unnamed protein product [Nesidiocoris tenuis]
MLRRLSCCAVASGTASRSPPADQVALYCCQQLTTVGWAGFENERSTSIWPVTVSVQFSFITSSYTRALCALLSRDSKLCYYIYLVPMRLTPFPIGFSKLSQPLLAVGGGMNMGTWKHQLNLLGSTPTPPRPITAMH